ncbi:peptide ABC transporter permease [Staphylococcus delphini]|uniref:peptide ABC transporter permease n=1 Tax=Staphylococcus delphini TaxID=53344 RepID=UPI001CCB49D4|nr:peptide ABC transporter permease [Staphylococcus delphini]MBZ8174624.1 peptide ABC transporter permease [Staphylococcus delphini]
MLQLKKSLSNHIFLMMIVIITLAFLLGYFLPVGIDKKNSVSYSEYMFSVYTVLTQFGFLLFCFMIAQFFNKDYADKNIVFYRVLGINVYQYFFSKVLVLVLEAIVCIFIGLVVVSLIYGDFSQLLIYFYFMALVTVQNILIVGIISTLFSSLILSIGISIAYWIFGILVSAFNSNLSFFAPFDASNDIAYHLSKLSGLNHGTIDQSIYLQGAIYIVGLAFICSIILFLSQKRWVKLGIRG